MRGTTFAFSGKGGSGKSTLSALVIGELVASGHGPVLAVDADPNATLSMALGIEQGETIADLRDRMGEAALKPGDIPKDRLMDQWLAELVSEQKGYDLLTMGRPEGPKCYCYVNGLLRRYLSLLRKSYACVVIDCEAGMEYLSRLVIDDIAALVLVAEPSAVGMTTVSRIAALTDSLPVRVHRRILALNKTRAPDAIERWGTQLPEITTRLAVPHDEGIARSWTQGDPLAMNIAPATHGAIAELTKACLEK